MAAAARERVTGEEESMPIEGVVATSSTLLLLHLDAAFDIAGVWLRARRVRRLRGEGRGWRGTE